MDYAEEQAQEREALAAIFLDDYTPLSDDGRRLQLALSHPAAGVSAKLIVTLPPTYPEASPTVSLHPGSGLTAPRRAALLGALEAEAAAQAGMPSIFGLHTFAMEWVQANVAGGEESEEEDVGGAGAELADAAAAAAAGASAGAGEAKLTGRQLFELNKAVVVEEDSESFWEAEADAELAAG
ncbi:hypothetical protein BU14_0412s0007 [Porphyra umbilicalis]|uniref:RWD domain-containing protein n=1 Tax=Porphyra umbilicalis TaxID=2786 RepID=A0A1X6NWF9_PORUM|nr:hypothetical protein BU14_0412s0007 [Porphyra umbilicalis]|eukprot:OSX72713.1 hypothetical protein BU14_0412s0007 [Porphyra umbilicalis]